MAGASLRVGANTSEFTSQMRSMLTQMKLVTSEYKVEAAQAKALGSQTDLLKAKKTELTAKIKLQTDAIKLQQTNLEAQKQKLTELQAAEQKLKEKVAELTKAYDESVKATGEDSEESKKLKAQLDETKEAHAKAENAVKKQEDAIAKNTIKLNESRVALAEEQAELKETEDKLKSAGDEFGEFGDEVENAGDSMDETGKKTVSLGDIIKANLISSAIINGVKALAKGIKELATAAIGVGADFESGMSQVAATMGITTEEIAAGSEEFSKLEAAAKEAGATTQFSATQAAEALNYMALAGYDADKSIETLPTVLNLAAAGGMDLATASDMVTDSMSALGDTAGTTESFVDKMAKTSQKSNTSVQQLGEAILTVGGTAKNLAGGVNEMNTVLGIFADNGVKGAEGGTALRNIILSLTAPTDSAREKMKELGLEVFDANGNMRPLNDTFNDLNAILGTMTQGEQTEVLNNIFNKTDLKSVNALLANSGERFDELSSYISDCDGAAADMAATMNDNLQGKVTILKSGLEGLGIAAYEKFKTPITNAVDNIITVIGNLQNDLTDGSLSGALEEIATGFGNMVEKASEIVAAVLPAILEGLGWIADNGEAVVSILAGIGAGFAAFKVASLIQTVVTAFQAFKVANEGATIAQWAMNAAMNANPIVLIITLVAGLIAAVVTFIATNEDARAAIAAVWEKIKAAIEIVVTAIVKFFTQTLPSAFAQVIEFLGNIVSQIKEAFNGVVTFLQQLPSKIWNAIVSTVDAIREWALGLKTAAEEGITQLVTNVVTFFSELPNKIAYVIGFCLGHILKFGIDLYTWATTEIPKFVKSIITFMQQLPGKIWNAIVGALQQVANWGTQLAAKGAAAAKGLFNAVVNGVSSLPGKMVEIGSNIVSGIWNGISSGWSWLKDKVSSLASSLLQGAKDALGIKSPSRLFRDLVGKMIPQGIGVGIDEELPTLQDDLQKGLQGMTAKVAAEVNPVAAVKNTAAKVIAIDKNLDTRKVTANNEIIVIVNTTNTTTLDKKVIAKEVKKEVVKGITKDQNDKDKTKGAA
ncbi:phage tail tape measure protein [bacterium C-53]|nr:phage tail tape measure protein [Lachnospiraceae bacterium]NBI03912.1 phage tail tape measure protein [Lachnospiraceae bacterium]RKJ09053.1 phage tail tape measure protein [bacterium C-53]